MSMTANAYLHEIAKNVTGLACIVPSTSTPDYVSLKGFHRFTAIISVKNATTVTGSAITLKQATTVAAGGEKPLAFTKVWANIDVGAGDTLTETAVTSNTFTTDATNSKDLKYIIEVEAADLDMANNFDCIRVGTGDGVAATVNVEYFLWPAKYAQTGGPMSAIID